MRKAASFSPSALGGRWIVTVAHRANLAPAIPTGQYGYNESPPSESEEVVVTMTESEWSDAGLRVAVMALMLASCSPFAASAQEDSAALETLVVVGMADP